MEILNIDQKCVHNVQWVLVPQPRNCSANKICRSLGSMCRDDVIL